MCELCNKWIGIENPIERQKAYEKAICKEIIKANKNTEELRVMGGC